MTYNESDHGTPTEVLFFLLNEKGRIYFHTSDAAIEAWKPGDILMVEHNDDNEFIRAGRAT